MKDYYEGVKLYLLAFSTTIGSYRCHCLDYICYDVTLPLINDTYLIPARHEIPRYQMLWLWCGGNKWHGVEMFDML